MSAGLISLIASALGVLVVVLRFALKRSIEKETREKVEAEHQLEEYNEYKRTREMLDEVKNPDDATIDELREWLRKRGQRKP